MLALMLSGVVGSASLVFFFSAFFAPKLHRKDDFLWSGFGFFYALVLWICAQRFTGAILLGQLAAVCLLLAFAWQTLRLRAAIANQAIAEVQSFSLLDWVGGGLKRKPKAPKVKSETQAEPAKEAVESTPATPTPVQEDAVAEEVIEKAVEEVDRVLETIEAPPAVVEAVEDIVETAVAEIETPETSTPASAEPKSPVPATANPKPPGDNLPKPKSKLFQWLFRGKKEPQPPTPSTNIADVIESVETEDEDWGEEDTVAEIVAAVEDTVEEVVEETMPPADNDVATEQSQPEQESPEKAVTETVVETPDQETVAPVVAETSASEPSSLAETVEVEPDKAEAEPDVTAEVSPVIPPSTTETEESNWDDLEQDFDPYLGGDDANTTIENADHPEEKP